MGTVTFGGTPADYALGENGKVATGVRFTVWTTARFLPNLPTAQRPEV